MVELVDYNARAVGIAWIRKEDYAAAVAIFEDGDGFFPTWEQWEMSAKDLEDRFKRDGYIVERVYIDPDTFPDWCRANGVRTGSEGRGRFAGTAVAKKYGRNQS